MISICIPIYNFDVRQLVVGLHAQALELNAGIEILLFDDCSNNHFKEKNRELTSLYLVSYLELSENIGRSRIRNAMAKEARHQHVVFMDCDSQLTDNLFLKRYIEHLPLNEVICGGRIYQDDLPENTFKLHWWYGKNRETIPVRKRVCNPYRSFMTNNFMAPKSVMLKIPFNELLTGYGHEDTLFGYELMRNNIAIKHIDNPLLHIGLQTNLEFLAKTREGVKNLATINKIVKSDSDFARMSKLLVIYNILSLLGLRNMGATLFRMVKKNLENNLLGQSPNLFLFDLYKLGFLLQEFHSEQN
ncbi:MAG TPA: glycosyltransferase family 2 protein [Bacteroidales bacterium]|nr:glycosyltransferase family 2 protein [Bacteroidales bacterium]